MWKYTYTDELYHHGILGMKWGIRKTRNEDGSLTKYGARKLTKQLNKSDMGNVYATVKYRDKLKKNNYMVYKLNKNEISYIRGKALTNAILLGPVVGTVMGSHNINKRLSAKFNNPKGIGPKLNKKPVSYTTLVTNSDKGINRYTKNGNTYYSEKKKRIK